jgi:hypothetical protein
MASTSPVKPFIHEDYIQNLSIANNLFKENIERFLTEGDKSCAYNTILILIFISYSYFTVTISALQTTVSILCFKTDYHGNRCHDNTNNTVIHTHFDWKSLIKFLLPWFNTYYMYIQGFCLFLTLNRVPNQNDTIVSLFSWHQTYKTLNIMGSIKSWNINMHTDKTQVYKSMKKRFKSNLYSLPIFYFQVIY